MGQTCLVIDSFNLLQLNYCHPSEQSTQSLNFRNFRTTLNFTYFQMN